MKVHRREFMGLVGAAMATASTPLVGFSGLAGELAHGVEKNGWRLQVSAAGEIVSFTDGKLELLNRRLGDTRPRVVVGGMRQYFCERPAVSRREGSSLLFRYDFSGRDNFSVNYELALTATSQGLVALNQKVGLQAPAKIRENMSVFLPKNIQLPFENRKVFLPMKDGIGRQKPIQGFESDDEYVYAMAGGYKNMGKPQQLAIPLANEYADQMDLRLAHCADPYFSSYFRLPYGGKAGNFNCLFLGEVGIEKEERAVYTVLHRGGEKAAMQVFYETALSDVEAGADWQHEVAMVDYDYLSKNGQGWFRDIDALAKLIAPRDRGKVFLALHGWYGYVGEYAFDWRHGAFFKEWTAFPSALNPKLQLLPDAPDSGTGYIWKKKPVRAMRPVPMSLADMHRRIRYAKDKGFRVGIYYADGTNACEGVKAIYDPSKVLRWGGWQGPDTKGKTYAQNPLHPEVREFYLKYIQALVEEYGREVDGFIWDETFVIGRDALGTAAAPGYASRAMMTLVRDVAATVAGFNPQLAFFASDCIGLGLSFDQAVPYALVAHGTYQDSGCAPVAWSYGLFPNYRNVLWSCNWAPVTRFEYSRYAVETFNVPVPISNGAFGDDIGISDMTAEQQKNIMALFNMRKNERMEIGWIKEDPWNLDYLGNDVKLKWSF
ncbi:MAG TPA: hypothetical protein VMW54_11860 [Terriglobia bacterium]|nr:hypothetical protein [Terriglobia bacterium]